MTCRSPEMIPTKHRPGPGTDSTHLSVHVYYWPLAAFKPPGTAFFTLSAGTLEPHRPCPLLPCFLHPTGAEASQALCLHFLHGPYTTTAAAPAPAPTIYTWWPPSGSLSQPLPCPPDWSIPMDPAPVRTQRSHSLLNNPVSGCPQLQTPATPAFSKSCRLLHPMLSLPSRHPFI